MMEPPKCCRINDSSGDSADSNSTAIREDPEEQEFVLPAKSVKSMSDMSTWQRSEAYYDLIGFINGVSIDIQGKRLSEDCSMSPAMERLLEVLKQLDKYIDENPPIDQPQRFGNKAYRSWFKEMQKNIRRLLHEALTDKYTGGILEIGIYLEESFGNETRIDYGTGHELSFIMFLCCLFKLGALPESDSVACALKLFNAYLVLVRRLQLTYRMEPAGSHGVWSLDDYQFVPFIWGSAQLALNAPFDPSKFPEAETIEAFKNEFMFMGCIDYICQVKTGHFAEHSNQLWSISAVPSWAKINLGLVKMYQKEILSKFPVVQHIRFGSLMPFKIVKPGRVLSVARLGMIPAGCEYSTNTPPLTREMSSGDFLND